MFLEKILPETAGIAGIRWRISAAYMQAMADFSDNGNIPCEIVDILYEIALQRISNGAVLHGNDPTPTLEALPKKFQSYSSCWDEYGVMVPECYQFLIKKLGVCCQRKATRKHALAICFGVSEHLTPEGNQRKNYIFGRDDFKPDGKELYQMVNALIQKWASKDEINRHWCLQEYWREHFEYFKEQCKFGALDPKCFVSRVVEDNRPKWIKTLFPYSKEQKAVLNELRA